MISKEAQDRIALAVEEEITAAISKHGQFRNQHEAWAVLQEEIDEVIDASAVFGNTVADAMAEMWELVKQDKLPDKELEENPLWQIFDKALNLACECVQVAAMCDKYNLLISEERKEYETNNY